MKRYLLLRKTTTVRFRLPVTTQSCYEAITIAYANEVASRGGSFILDINTSDHIKRAAEWLTDEKPKYGMLLCGQCGNGKTTLVKAIDKIVRFMTNDKSYDEQKFIKIVDAKEIVHLAKCDDKAYKALCNTEMLAIDDLGIEPSEVLDYGNVLNPAIDLLTYRYNEQLFTIITTNLTPKQIREHYGDRIADRFNEMMSRIVFNNSSYRTL